MPCFLPAILPVMRQGFTDLHKGVLALCKRLVHHFRLFSRTPFTADWGDRLSPSVVSPVIFVVPIWVIYVFRLV